MSNLSWSSMASASKKYDYEAYKNPYPDEHVVHIIVLIWTAVILVFGVVGNVLVIAAVWLHRSLRTIGNVFIVNLAVADASVSLIVNGFGIVGMATDARFFMGRDWLCEIVGTACVTCCACSMWTIAAISFNRYVSICHWPHYGTIYNKKTVIGMVFSIWLLSFLIDLPNIIGWGIHRFDWKIMLCSGYMAFDRGYTIFFGVSAFAAPLLLIVLSYVRIYLHATHSTGELQRVSAQNGQATNRASDLRLARSIFIIIVVFIAMWAPYVMSTIIAFDRSVSRNAYIFSILLAHTNSSLNCFLYAATNRNFRQGYALFFSLLFCRRVKAPKLVEQRQPSVSQITLDTENRM